MSKYVVPESVSERISLLDDMIATYGVRAFLRCAASAMGEHSNAIRDNEGEGSDWKAHAAYADILRSLETADFVYQRRVDLAKAEGTK